MNTICTTPFNALKRSSRPANLVLSSAVALDDQAEIVVRRAVKAIEAEQPKGVNAIQFVRDCVWDKAPDNFPAWDMIEELFGKIRAMPGSAYAFRYLLINAESARQETHSWWHSLIPCADVLENKVYGMCKFLADRAMEELAAYEAKAEDAIRPADTARAYGLALQYATEVMGSFVARKAIARLMLATPLPWEEAINPDWVDAYTSENDPDAAPIRVRDVSEVSSDGNVPQMIQDLLDNLSEDDAAAFQEQLKVNGSSLDEYWLQFREAQRSGYAVLPEPEEEWEEPEFGVNEKDFQFQEDLEVTEAADKLKYELREELAYMKEVIQATAEFSNANLKTFADEARQRIYAELKEAGKPIQPWKIKAQSWEEAWAKVHVFFRKDKRTVWFMRCIKRAVSHYTVPNVMSILLPFQNSFGFWEDDLYEIRLPHGRITLAHWYAMFGDAFLEPFVNRETVDYGDPAINREYANKFVRQSEPDAKELEVYVWDTVNSQAEVYQESEKRRQVWCTQKGILYKTDTRWHPAFIFAEVQAAIIGEGGSTSAQAAGWDAWRQSIDPEANAAFKKRLAELQKMSDAELKKLKITRKQIGKVAMEKFWEVFKANKNKIVSMNRKGVKLQSGREIDWGILLLKLKANEIPMTITDYENFLQKITQFNLGTAAIRAFLQQKVKNVAEKTPEPVF